MTDNKAIQALSDGLLDGGCELVTNFPGFMSHKLFTALGGKITSVNEKIAYETAWGSSYAGKRSVVTFKNVGLSDAADPFINSMLVGVNAGLVMVVFDDVHVEGSQSRQDSRNYYDFFGGLWFEPYSLENAYEVCYKAFELSEKFRFPVVVRITNQLLQQQDSYTRKEKIELKHKNIINDQERFVVHPVHSRIQQKLIQEKNKEIQKYVNGLYEIENSETNSNVLIVAGCCEAEEKEFMKGKYAKLQLYTYPLPEPLIEKNLQGIESLMIFEQGNAFVKEKILALNSKLNNENIISNTGIVPDKSDGYIITKNYEKLFHALKNLNLDAIFGDLGEYTKDTLSTIDGCLCFGSSLSVGMGAILAGPKRVVSVIGDAAYLHSGKNVIPEAIERKIPIKAIVIDNGGSQGTGGQSIAGDLYYQPDGVEIYKATYSETQTIDFERIISTMLSSDKVSILYVSM
jgi:indolepyruvate ferredoxin oxidoreductase alpha subunit